MLKIFVVAVQNRLTKIVRDLFPFIRRLNSSMIESLPKEALPKEVKKALKIDIPPPMNDDGGEHEMYSYDRYTGSDRRSCSICLTNLAGEECAFCRFSRCSICEDDDDEDGDNECEGCRSCRNTSPLFKEKQDECQCINPLAAKELIKAGLW